MVDDDQLVDLARRAGVVIYPIGLLAPPAAGSPAPTLPTYVLTALARESGGRAYFPLARGARRDLRPHRLRPAHPLRRRLRVVESPRRRRVAADRGQDAPGGPDGPAPHRLLGARGQHPQRASGPAAHGDPLGQG